MKRLKDLFPDAPDLAETPYHSRRNGKSDGSIKTRYKRELVQSDNPAEDGGLKVADRPSDRDYPKRKNAARKPIFAVDIHGRSERLPVEGMSEPVYRKLLEAARNPLQVDDPVPEMVQRLAPAPVKPPQWWEIPGPEASTEEIKAAIRRNLTELAKRRGNAPEGWKRAL